MQLMRICAAMAGLAVLAAPAIRATERSDVPDGYKWNLSDLYPDESAWVAAKQDLAVSIPKLGQWQGKLGSSAATLLAAMTAWEQSSLKVERLYSYANQLYDQDTRVSRALQMKQEASQVYTELQTAAAFMQPEILAIGRARIDGFLVQEPKLGEYRMFFDNVLRAAPHTLSPAEEKIVAQTGLMSDTGQTVRSVFTSSSCRSRKSRCPTARRCAGLLAGTSELLTSTARRCGA